MRQYLHEQYAQKLTLDVLSARYNISKYHLQRSFQHYFGQSPGEYLTQLRLTRAKELLRATDLPVSEVAYRVGMDNTSYFIYTFRTHEGTTPRQYRKSWSMFDTDAPVSKRQKHICSVTACIIQSYRPTIFPKICFFPSSYRWITTMTVSPVLKSESS